MKTIRAILTGTLVWALIFSVFTILSFVPGVNDSQALQGVIVAVFIIPFAMYGAAIYYKKGDRTNGAIIGLIMVATALILDALITVPFVEIPYNGGSFLTFFTNPLLWILVLENIAVIYFYWRLKVRDKLSVS